MAGLAGEIVTEALDYDGGRQVTAYVPPVGPEVLVYAGDGHLVPLWAQSLEDAGARPTMVVGSHGDLSDEMMARLHEYSPVFDADRFSAHEAFFTEDVPRWARSRFGVDLPRDRTAVLGVSASGELALAMGVRHPERYGAVLCGSPGAGYPPPEPVPATMPRTYLVAGDDERFYFEAAERWAVALRATGIDVVLEQRPGSHGGAFWWEELPRMVAWAFGSAA